MTKKNASCVFVDNTYSKYLNIPHPTKSGELGINNNVAHTASLW